MKDYKNSEFRVSIRLFLLKLDDCQCIRPYMQCVLHLPLFFLSYRTSLCQNQSIVVRSQKSVICVRFTCVERRSWTFSLWITGHMLRKLSIFLISRTFSKLFVLLFDKYINIYHVCIYVYIICVRNTQETKILKI